MSDNQSQRDKQILIERKTETYEENNSDGEERKRNRPKRYKI